MKKKILIKFQAALGTELIDHLFLGCPRYTAECTDTLWNDQDTKKTRKKTQKKTQPHKLSMLERMERPCGPILNLVRMLSYNEIRS